MTAVESKKKERDSCFRQGCKEEERDDRDEEAGKRGVAVVEEE